MKNHFKTIKKYNEDETKQEYIGLRIKEEEIEFIFPYQYEIPTDEKELKKEMLNLIKLIDRYKTEKNVIDQKGNKKYFPYDSYLWIIEDYIKNGYYVEKECQYTKKGNNGKIDWKRTIKNNKIYLDNKNIVYQELVKKQSNYNLNNRLTKIYMFCVEKATEIMGWYYDVPILKTEKQNMGEKEMVEILRKECKKTFLDRKKRLLLNMIKILEGLEKTHHYAKRFEVATREFEYILQRIVEERFGTEKIVGTVYKPTAKWQIGEKEKVTKSLTPDTIIKYNNKICILDAKYYYIGYTNNLKDLPNASDMNKQIIYAENIIETNQDKIQEIYNIFIMPYRAKEKDEYMKYLGYGTVSWKRETCEKTYHKIHIILVDLKKLINNTFGSKKENIEKLLNVLEVS